MKFFISYSRSVQSSVRDIVDSLRDIHADVWWDQDLRAGQDWWATILDNIETSHVLIFMVSAKSMQSPYCMAELRYALARNRLVLPYVMDAPISYALPPEITHIQFESYNHNPDHFRDRLRKTCRHITWAQYQDRYAPRPAEPNTGSDDLVDQLDKALSLAHEGYFDEAMYDLNTVMHQAYDEYGAFCHGWIEKISHYREVTKMAQRPTMRQLALSKWDEFTQQYGEEFDPLYVSEKFSTQKSRLASRASQLLDEYSPSQPPYAAPMRAKAGFDVYEAIMQFQTACDGEDWETALHILDVIRSSGVKVPHVFNINAYEQEIQAHLDAEECDKNYHLIGSLLKMKRPHYKLICEALETFWSKYPDYDPDGLRESKDLLARAWLNVAHSRDPDNYAAQIEAYTEALRVKPDFFEGYMERGSCHYFFQVYDLATDDFTCAIQINPQDSEAHYNRAFSYAAQSLRGQAISDFKIVLKLNPAHRHAEGIPKLLELLAKNRKVMRGA